MRIYESTVKGLNEAIEYANGNGVARTTKCTVKPVPEFNAKEIRDLRKSLGMTLHTFAEVVGVSQKAVEAWETGTNTPNGSARRLISILQADPSIISKFDVIVHDEIK